MQRKPGVAKKVSAIATNKAKLAGTLLIEYIYAESTISAFVHQCAFSVPSDNTLKGPENNWETYLTNSPTDRIFSLY